MSYTFPIPYRIERTRNKHSRAVFRDDTIVIRLAKNLSSRQEREHIQNLLDRMRRQLQKIEQCVTIDPFRPLLEGAARQRIITNFGKKYTITLVPAARNRLTITQDTWQIEVGPRADRRLIHRTLWRALCQASAADFEARTHHLNRTTLNVRISEIRVKHAASQWGSCSSKGVIMLNAALLFLPAEARDYVIVHELAHRKRADHSPRYWNIVKGAWPEYHQHRQLLKQYQLPRL